MNRVPMVQPRGRNDLEIIAQRVLRDFNPRAIEMPQPLDVERFCDVYLPRIGFDIDLIQLEGGVEGLTDPIRRVISIPPETHMSMLREDGRARFTIVHEGVHAIVHADEVKEKLVNFGGNCLLRRAEIPRYRDPEWQAHYMAGALLMPEPAMRKLIAAGGVTVTKISGIFKVSFSAAETRLHYVRMRMGQT